MGSTNILRKEHDKIWMWKGGIDMATSTITAKFKVSDEKSAKKICDALDGKSTTISPSQSRNGESKDVSRLLKALRR